MSNYKLLKDKIAGGKAKICVVGLGYVGLPLAVSFAKKGYTIFGYDSNLSRIKKLEKGVGYIVDISPKEVLSLIKRGLFIPCGSSDDALKKADIIIVCVPTPLRKVKVPDISYVIAAAKTISRNMRRAQLLILESTSYPSTTRGVVLPILRKSGLKEEEDFFLCFSPERVDPGNKKYPLRKIPKIVGGLSKASGLLAKSLYSKIIKDVFTVSTPEVAESAKILENTFRLVNIALVNEFAILCHKLGVDVWEVINAAKTKPFGFVPFYPGPGVGGHCIPADPLYLSWKAKTVGFKTKMIDLASFINHYMPEYIVKRLEESVGKKGVSLSKAKILILGVTYKKDVKDLRESPALDIIEKLQKLKVEVSYYDPLIPYLKIDGINLKSVNISRLNFRKYDCVIITVGHTAVNYKLLRDNAKLIFDLKNIYKRNFKNVERI